MNHEKKIYLEDVDLLFSKKGKYNDRIVLTDEDKKAGVKIYCMEPYAQQLYDAMRAYDTKEGHPSYISKDLSIDSIYEVRATFICFDTKIITVEEPLSKINIDIPFKEYSGEINNLGYIGSERKCNSINYKKELFKHLDENTWFEVKVCRLIKGGYIATYKDSIECFIPGSHAAANVIRDFKDLIGQSMNIMIDNYDQSNDLFILSYKKYIEHSIPQMITELKFGQKYLGKLTNNPYDFGIFVEFENYFTGLIHSSEFENYDQSRKQYKVGDKIEFYVKNVIKKGNQYRVVLTLKEDDIDSEKRKWSDLREKTENKSFNYEIDLNNNSIKIKIENDSFEVTLKRKDLQKNIDLYPMVKVYKVDPINKNLKFEFVEG
jgi:ribosomal protein S1